MHFSEEPMSEELKNVLRLSAMLHKNSNRVVDPEKPLPENKIHACFINLWYLLGKENKLTPQIEKYIEAALHLKGDSFIDFSKIYLSNRKGHDCIAVFYLPNWYKDLGKAEDPANLLRKLGSDQLLRLAKKSNPLSHYAINLGNQSGISSLAEEHPEIDAYLKQNSFIPADVVWTWLYHLKLVGTIYPIVEDQTSEDHRRRLCELLTIDGVIYKAVESDIQSCHMEFYQSPTSPGRAEELLLGMGPDNHTDLNAYKKDLAKRKAEFLRKNSSILTRYNLRAEVIEKYNSAFNWRGY